MICVRDHCQSEGGVLSHTVLRWESVIAFLAMVTLGLLIGLAFLPVILSICGPVVCVSTEDLGKPNNSARTTGKQRFNRYADSKLSPTSQNTEGESPTSGQPNPYKLLDTMKASREDEVNDSRSSESPSSDSKRAPEAPGHTDGTQEEEKRDEAPSWVSGALHQAPSHVPQMPDEDEEHQGIEN